MTPKPSRMDTYFVYCKGTRELLQDRIAKRKGHFMGAKVSFESRPVTPIFALPRCFDISGESLTDTDDLPATYGTVRYGTLWQMLDSQLSTLEEPEDEDGVVAVDISRTPAEITTEAVQKVMAVSKS
jgi:hypothetical protein